MTAARAFAAVALAGVAVSAVVLSRGGAASPVLELPQGDAGLNLDNLGDAWGAWSDEPVTIEEANRNRAAFLMMLRHAEGTADPEGYRALFGHTAARPKLFDSWADHPRRAVQFTDGAGRRLWTSAAGAFQFMAVSPLPDGSGRSTRVDTWDRLRASLALPDFGPASQDRAALALVDECGALDDVDAGRVVEAVRKCRRVWASLPGAGYAQGERSMEWLTARYAAAGGELVA